MLSAEVQQRFAALLPEDCFLQKKEDRLCYSYDSQTIEAMPWAVLTPLTTEQVSRIMQLCYAQGIPVIARGAGSGTTGGSVPVGGGIVLSLHKMNTILEVDDENFTATVEAGVVTGDLHKAVEAKGMLYPPDPASLAFSTVGGNIAENAGGMRAVKYGVTANYVRALEVVLADGTIIQVGSACVKDVVGYTMAPLFVGSEGTLGIVTKACLRLVPLPACKKTARIAFASLEDAGRAVTAIIHAGSIPTILEFMDATSIRCVEEYLQCGLPTQAGALLLVEVDGDSGQVQRDMQKVLTVCEQCTLLEVNMAENEAEQELLWKVRRSIPASLLRLRPVRFNEDIVVPRSRIPEMIRRMEAIARRHDLIIAGFGHAGDGNIHVNVLSRQDAGELQRAHAAVEDVFQASAALGGRISGEHGVGLTKKSFIPLNMDAPTLQFMRMLKQTLDPKSILNPHKVFPDPEKQV